MDAATALSGGLVPEGTPHHTGNRFLTVNSDNYQWLPDQSVDFILTDPPFNIAQDTNFHTWEKNTIHSYRFDKDKDWDTYEPDQFISLLGEWSREFARVLRPSGSFVVFMSDEYLSPFRSALRAAGLDPKRTLTWRKPNAVPINRKYMFMSATEYVIVGTKGKKTTFNADLPTEHMPEYIDIERFLAGDKAGSILNKMVSEAVSKVTTIGAARPIAVADASYDATIAAADIVRAKTLAMYTTDDNGDTYLRGCLPNHIELSSKGGKRLHPTEKPVPLLRFFTALLSKPGDLVLDPFGGSGSTGQACLELNRQPIIVERETDFYETLTNRLQTIPDTLPLDN